MRDSKGLLLQLLDVENMCIYTLLKGEDRENWYNSSIKLLSFF